jgi:hypothetical protein
MNLFVTITKSCQHRELLTLLLYVRVACDQVRHVSINCEAKLSQETHIDTISKIKNLVFCISLFRKVQFCLNCFSLSISLNNNKDWHRISKITIFTILQKSSLNRLAKNGSQVVCNTLDGVNYVQRVHRHRNPYRVPVPSPLSRNISILSYFRRVHLPSNYFSKLCLICYHMCYNLFGDGMGQQADDDDCVLQSPNSFLPWGFTKSYEDILAQCMRGINERRQTPWFNHSYESKKRKCVSHSK